jgi:hypothetical protein
MKNKYINLKSPRKLGLEMRRRAYSSSLSPMRSTTGGGSQGNGQDIIGIPGSENNRKVPNLVQIYLGSIVCYVIQNSYCGFHS